MKHCLFTLYGCDFDKLNDLDLVSDSITKLANSINATILNLASHKFSPQGVTAVLLLAESHISIHTWPEDSVAVCDLFTCSDVTWDEISEQIRIFAEYLNCSYIDCEARIDRDYVKVLNSEDMYNDV